MKFLVDAQLPRRLSNRLCSEGHDAIHTRDLPNANRTTDSNIIALAAKEERVVVTKDTDFVNTFLVTGEPRKLLLISTGNITNHDLERILFKNLAHIVSAFDTNRFVEMNRTSIIIHA